MADVKGLLKEKLTPEHYGRLVALDNPKMHDFVADAIRLMSIPARMRMQIIFESWR
jgi:hypothetical protein